jgi:hypothetical protein
MQTEDSQFAELVESGRDAPDQVCLTSQPDSRYARGNPSPGLVPTMVAELAKIATARVAVTNTRVGDGAEGHKSAMKKADAGHGLLKKFEELGHILDDRIEDSHGAGQRMLKKARDRIDALYTKEENGSTVLASSDGKAVSSLRAQIAEALGEGGHAIVERVLGKMND